MEAAASPPRLTDALAAEPWPFSLTAGTFAAGAGKTAMLTAFVRLVSVSALAATAIAAQEFRDRATHRTAYLQRPDARLHYLEWPGRGPTVVLLPGFSLTAHVYDAIGEALQGTYHVLALTPRGFGQSDAPPAGPYTIAALVDDLRALLDSAGVSKAVLVGHSLSGTVAARFALAYPDRVTQLILLDAFPYFMEEGGEAVDAKNPVSRPAFTGDTTYRDVAAYLARYRFVPWNAAFEADLRAKPLEPEASRRRTLAEGYLADDARAPTELRGLRTPSVQVCALPTARSEYPWLSRTRTRAAFDSAAQFVRNDQLPFARRLCDRYARTVPQGRSIALSGSHYLFFTHPQRTIEVLRQVVRAR